ncbi:MAG: glycosyl transferase, partial [Microbacterium sp.]|nr:glycosyl transferase [Microbacterium sp.]
MPARVHAVLVVRPEGRIPAAPHLTRTLEALAAQTRPVDALTIVLCGNDPALTRIAAASGAEGVITASAGTTFAAATALATPRLTGDAVWLLAQDTAPDPDALLRLAGALELSSSLAVAAPKLVAWDDPAEIVSLGVSMTRYGRTVELAAGELDQGQRDGDADVLGADVRGMLVHRDSWRALGGLDPALGGADEGLDL